MLGRFPVSVRKRVLFLCNEPRLTRLVRQALDETGEYLIREEPDREVAAETAQKFQPDLILLDVTGEEIGGTEALEQIRIDAALGDAPIIALQSENGDAAIAFSSSLEGYECSAGPIDMESLVRCVEEMLDQSLTDQGTIAGGIFQIFQTFRILDFQQENPAFSKWIGVD